MMKMNKSTKAMIAFGIGACLFASTAFADMLVGSGYDKLKSSAKNTTSVLASKGDSFTLETTMAIKIDGEILNSSYELNKINRLANQKEQLSFYQGYQDEGYEYYTYSDNKHIVRRNSHDNQTYVTEFTPDYKPSENRWFNDPLAANGVSEMEKILDAVVGNLKDLVQVDNNSDGSFSFNGKLSAAQIPALVNAVGSFAIKQAVETDRYSYPQLPEFASDLYVTSVEGFATENENNLLSQLQGSIAFSGKDIDGKQHTIGIEVSILLKDVNSTEISVPDTTNAIVEQYQEHSALSNISTGKYVNNIVIQKNSEVIKIGERTLIIDEITKDRIVGTFEEKVFEGYEAEYEASSVTFTGIEEINHEVLLKYVDSQGKEGAALLYQTGLDRLNLNYNIELIEKDERSYSVRTNSQNQYYGELTKVFK